MQKKFEMNLFTPQFMMALFVIHSADDIPKLKAYLKEEKKWQETKMKFILTKRIPYLNRMIAEQKYVDLLYQKGFKCDFDIILDTLS